MRCVEIGLEEVWSRRGICIDGEHDRGVVLANKWRWSGATFALAAFMRGYPTSRKSRFVRKEQLNL